MSSFPKKVEGTVGRRLQKYKRVEWVFLLPTGQKPSHRTSACKPEEREGLEEYHQADIEASWRDSVSTCFVHHIRANSGRDGIQKLFTVEIHQ